MEHGTATLPFLMIRTGSKRTRSPDSASPVERAAKRIPSESDSRWPSPSPRTLEEANANGGGTQHGYTRHLDEWVTRTGSMQLLDTPHALIAPNSLPNDVVTQSEPTGYTDMSMDMDDASGTPNTQQMSPSSIMSTTQPYHYQNQQPFAPMETQQATDQPFFVSPSNPRPTYASPTTMPGFQQHRPRFTLGPKANCELCRLRVPGHYAHL